MSTPLSSLLFQCLPITRKIIILFCSFQLDWSKTTGFEMCATFAYLNLFTSTRVSSLLHFFTILSLLAIGTIGVRSDPAAKIQSGLYDSSGAKRNILIHFGDTSEMENIAYQVYSEYGTPSSAEYPRTERIYALYTALSEYSHSCQESAKSYLSAGGYSHRALWATNTIVVKGADEECARRLAQMDDVSSITEDKSLPLFDPIKPVVDDPGSSSAPQPFRVGLTWGLSAIQVKKAWEWGSVAGELKQGGGVLVGTIDTGVRVTHEALRDNWREYDGWADGYNISHTPIDDVGHGVAPAAQWITCRGCKTLSCLYSSLLFCCQWIICPYDTSKGPAPPSYKHCYPPDLVSNSWGGDPGDTTFDQCIIALHSAGIIPIWANGNSGPNCSTAGGPGDSPNVIGVGAADHDNALADWSSRGPSVIGGALKPDISGPGVEVKSSWNRSDTDYVTVSGTSMATPHVAGLVALILERCKHLPYHLVLDVLQTTADREDLGISEMMCGDTRSDLFPNNFYGWGRINAFSAIQKAVDICEQKSNHNHLYYKEDYYQGHLSYSFGNKLGGFTSRYAGLPYFQQNVHNTIRQY